MAKIERINDAGLRNMLEVTARNDGRSILTGIFQESRAVRSAVNGSPANQLAYRYALHDEPRGNNPDRETLSPSIARSLSGDAVVRSFLALDLDKGQRAFERNVTRAGLRLAANVKKAITDLKTPAKKQATIRAAQLRYGGNTRSNPLIQTGEMRNAVNFRYQ